jgi:hypothetical protein
MRRFLVALLAASAVFGAIAAPAAAQTLDIRFQTALTKPHATCEGEGIIVLCAPVTVPGYGEGTLTFTGTSFELISDSCAEYGGTTEIAFVDPTIETIVMSESGVVCFPGNSLNAATGGHSFGNPFHQTGTFVIESGPAELVALSGTSEVASAGAAFKGVYSIELE